MKKNNLLSRLAYNTGFAGLVSAASLVKFSWIVGSQISFFSGINIMAPLSGAFGGVLGSIVTFAVRAIAHLLFFGALSIKFLTIGVPTLCASLYWSTSHWLIRAGLPLACMLLFWAHPVGAAASAYALYWLVPVAVHCLAGKNLFFEALGSTFVAHAVGSVIWLYAVPMAPSVWLALIPVVAIERLLFATGMMVAHYAISSVMNAVRTKHVALQLRKA